MITLEPDNNPFFETDYDIIILAGQSNCMGYSRGVETYLEDIRSKTLYRDDCCGQGKPRRDKNKFYFHNTCPQPSLDYSQTGFYMYFGQLYID